MDKPQVFLNSSVLRWRFKSTAWSWTGNGRHEQYSISISFQGLCNKLPQPGCLKIRDSFSYSSKGQQFNTGYTGLKSRHLRGHTPLQVLGMNLSLAPLPTFGGCWHSLACSCITSNSACVVALPSPCLSSTLLSGSNLSVPLSHKDRWLD